MQPSRLVQARAIPYMYISIARVGSASVSADAVGADYTALDVCPELASCQVASSLMQIRDQSSESEATELPERLQNLARQASLGVISPLREQSWAGRAAV